MSFLFGKKKSSELEKGIKFVGDLATQIEKEKTNNQDEDIDEFDLYIEALKKTPHVEEQIPNLDHQVNALEKFKKGEMTYAQMREECG